MHIELMASWKASSAASLDSGQVSAVDQTSCRYYNPHSTPQPKGIEITEDSQGAFVCFPA